VNNDLQNYYRKRRSDMVEYFPPFEQHGTNSIDERHIPLAKPGVYYLTFSNEKSWIRSINVHYQFTFTNADHTTTGAQWVQPLNF
jgi:hypothetical protein